MTALQIAGTLVAIPVGLASVYSIYHSNFTVEARCETLRANIVGLLDKSADASTLRMLARRDVVAFETSCGAVDPDAVKAFKALLTAATTPTPPPTTPKQIVREPVQKPAEAVKQVAPPPKPVVVETKPAPIAVDPKPAVRDAVTSDAKWVNSVRDALTHAPAHEEAVEAPAVPPPPPVVSVSPPSPPPPRVVIETPQPAAPASPPLQLTPPPMPVAAAPAPTPAANHPVPPGTIPDGAPVLKPAEKTSEHSWLAKIPLVNRVVGD